MKEYTLIQEGSKLFHERIYRGTKKLWPCLYTTLEFLVFVHFTVISSLEPGHVLIFPKAVEVIS